MTNVNQTKNVPDSVWEQKDRAIDAQSAIKSATNFYQGTDKEKETLKLAQKFYKFIRGKRENKEDTNNEPF